MHRFKEGEFAWSSRRSPSARCREPRRRRPRIVQTASILRYVGKVLDGSDFNATYPADAAVAQRVDAMMDQTKDAQLDPFTEAARAGPTPLGLGLPVRDDGRGWPRARRRFWANSSHAIPPLEDSR